MPRFRKKPVEVEAIQWTGDNLVEVVNFGAKTGAVIYVKDGQLLIPTLEGPMAGKVGDMIIRGVKGEVYACDLDIFHLTYNLIND